MVKLSQVPVAIKVTEFVMTAVARRAPRVKKGLLTIQFQN